MSFKDFDKTKLAAIGVAVLAIIILFGGYLVSICGYSSAIAKAQAGLQVYMVNSYPELKEKNFSVEFYEADSSLLTHEVKLVMTDGTDSISVPMTINLGYSKYIVDFDFVNATVNKENAIKYLGLDLLTALEAKGTYSICSGKFKFDSKASFLNDVEALKSFAAAKAFDRRQGELAAKAAEEEAKVVAAAKLVPAQQAAAPEAQVVAEAAAQAVPEQAAPADAPEYVATVEGAPAKFDPAQVEQKQVPAMTKMQAKAAAAAEAKEQQLLVDYANEELAALKQELAFKNVGTAHLNVTVDSDENVQTSVYVDSFLNDGFGISELKIFGNSRGLLNVLDLGRNEIAFNRAYILDNEDLNVAKNGVIKLNSSHVFRNGNFDLNYDTKIEAIGFYQDLAATGMIKGLNVHLFNTDDFIGLFADLVENNGVSLEVNKGSSFKVPAYLRESAQSKAQNEIVAVTFDGALSLPKGESMGLFTLPQGKFNLTFDTASAIEYCPIPLDTKVYEHLTVKNGVTSGTLEFGAQGAKVNGVALY